MKQAESSQGTWIVRLEPSDDLHESIARLAQDHQISNAAIVGIGSIDSPTIAHYSMVTRQFTNRKLTGIFEVTSLIGNIALLNQKPQAHLHITVSDPEMVVLGGHLVKGTCSATLELIITKLDSAFTKLPDDRVGLNLWDLPASDH